MTSPQVPVDKLEQALDKALERPGVGGWAGRNAAKRRGPSLVDPSKVQEVAFGERQLRRSKVVAQIAEQGSAPLGQHRAVEAFRMVRTRAVHALDAADGRAQVVAVTSPRQGDGKTLVSINLAIGIARQPHRHVLLIDGDLRRPGIAKALGLQPSLGFSDYLSGAASLEEAAVAAPGGRLFIVPQVKAVGHSSELLANGVLAGLAKTVQRKHPDWTVVIDCPPILAVDDTLVIMRAAEKAVLVVREGRTRRSEMRRAAQAIGHEKYLGTILNDSRASASQGHQYYYDYGYESR